MKKHYILTSLILCCAFFSQAQESNIQARKWSNMGTLIPFTGNDTIPIRIYNDEIILKVSVNGIENEFMWDNGFSFSAIDKTIADKIKLTHHKEINSLEATDAINEKMELDIKIAKEVNVNNIKIKNSPFLILNLENLFASNEKIKGVLGASIIKKLNWSFNFDENYVIVSQKPFEAKGTVIPFRINDFNTSYTYLEINGAEAEVEIDFGFNGGDLQVDYNAIVLFKNTPKCWFYGIGTSSVSGFQKTDTSYTVKDFNYKIGGVVLDHPIELFLTKAERLARIGNRMFRHYNCIVNHTTGEIILTKRKTTIAPMPEKSFGFTFLKIDNQLKVVSIENNPNFSKNKDLKLGTTVLTLNGKEASHFKNNKELKDYQINLLLKEKDLVVKTEKGKKFTLTAAHNIYE